MDGIVPLSVQESPGMQNNTVVGPVKLTKSQKKFRKMQMEKESARALSESCDKREDTGNLERKLEVSLQEVDINTQSSIQDSLNTGEGTSTTLEGTTQSKMDVVVPLFVQESLGMENNTAVGPVELSRSQKRNRKKGKAVQRALESSEACDKKEDTENPERKLEDRRQDVDTNTQSSIQDSLNTVEGTTTTVEGTTQTKMDVIVPLYVQESPGMQNNTVVGPVKLTKSQKKFRKMQMARGLSESCDKTEGTGNPERKLEVSLPKLDIITQSSIQDSLNTGEGTTTTVVGTTQSKMDVIVPLFVQESLGMEENTAVGPVKLTRSRKGNRKKRKAEERALESSEACYRKEDTENPERKLEDRRQDVDTNTQSTIQDSLNTAEGTATTVEGTTQSKMDVLVPLYVQESPGMQNNTVVGPVKLTKSQKKARKMQMEKESARALSESCDKREDTGIPERKLEVSLQKFDIITQSSIQDSLNNGEGTATTVEGTTQSKMDVIVPLFVQESLGMENDTAVGPVELTRSQKRNRKKRKAEERALESSEACDKKEDTENPERKLEDRRQDVDTNTQSSIQDGLNTVEGTTTTVEGTTQSKMDVIVPLYIQESPGLQNNTVVGPVKLTKSQKKFRKMQMEKETARALSESCDKREDTGNPERKLEVSLQKFDIITQSSIHDSLNMGEGTPTAVEGTTQSKMDVIVPFSIHESPGMENNTAMGPVKLTKSQKRNMQKRRAKERAHASSESCDKREDTGNPEGKLEVPCQDDTNTQPSIHDSLNTVKGKTTTVVCNKTASSANAAGVVKSSLSIIERYTEIAKGENGSSITTTFDSKTGFKREEHMGIANGQMGSNTTSTLQAKSTVSQRPTLGENLNPRYLEDREAANGETGMGTTATSMANCTRLKKRKTQQSENEKPASGGVLNTYDNIEDMEIVKTGSSTSAVLEARSTKTKKEEYIRIVNGENSSRSTATLDEMVSSTTTTLDAKSTRPQKKTKKKSIKRKKPTLGEILDPRYLEKREILLLNSTVSRKRQKQALGNFLNTHENTEHKEAGKIACVTTSGVVLNTHEKTEHKEAGKLACVATSGDILNIHEKTEHKEAGQLACGATSGNVLNTHEKTEQKGAGKLACVVTSGDVLNIHEKTEHKEAGKLACVTTLGDVLNTHEKKEHKEIAKIPTLARSTKKLLIFDVNGLLADIVSPRPKDRIAHKYIPKRAIFRRPFLDDFLDFCFENFDVAIWSSRTKKILYPVVDFLLRGLKSKLLFIWDTCNCTRSRTKTLEDKHKPIVFKKLSNVWEKFGPDNTWLKGYYDESNTLLLDDSPYKALLNPKHTGIFPVSYSYTNLDDNSLGPEGELRNYLEGLAAAENVKTYLEQHPFGQPAIDETSPDWAFYSQILERQNRRFTSHFVI